MGRRPGVLAAAAALAIVAWGLAPPTRTKAIPPAALSAPPSGHYYAFRLAANHWYGGLRPDHPRDTEASRLRLFEDGRPLGPAHANHAEIAAAGGGRYSHWNGLVLFSTSDNTNPRTNGREYQVRYPVYPPRLAEGAAYAVLGLAGGLQVFNAFRRDPRATRRRLARSGLCLAALLLALALAAFATRWLPIEGRMEFQPASMSAGQGEGRYLLPLPRLVRPFLYVPSPEAGRVRGITGVSWGRFEFREADPPTPGLDADRPVFVDNDRAGGEGLSLLLPAGADAPPPTEPVKVSYRARVTDGGMGLLLVLALPALLLGLPSRRGWEGFRFLPRLALACGSLGAGLLALNLAGFFFQLRGPTLKEPSAGASAQHVKGDIWLDYAEAALARRAGEGPQDFVARATTTVAGTVRHLWTYGSSDRLRLQVPLFENYLLWLAGEIKDSHRRYYFADWRKALERGAGMCGQVSVALVGILRENGLDARVAQLGGHTVSTVEVSPGRWWVADADFGVVLPHSLDEVAARPGLAGASYLAAFQALDYADPAAMAAVIESWYGPEGNSIEPQGGHEMLGEAWLEDESRAYRLKWLLPALLLAAGLALALADRRLRLAIYRPARPMRAGCAK